MKNTTVGVDFGKDVIQVCVYANKKVHSNTEMTHHDFLEWVFKTEKTTIVLEACGTSNSLEAKSHRGWTCSSPDISRISIHYQTESENR